MAGKGRSRKAEDFSIEQLMQQLATGLKTQAKYPNVFAYKPHSKQEVFHKSSAQKKLYIGGNRSGKTTGSVVEDIWWLTNTHPYRETPEAPIRGRVVGVDFTQGIEKILLPQFKQWLPPSYLIDGSWEKSYSRELRTLTLTNGSFVEFMSYDQDTDKFAGTSRHFVHYDEEPPLHVFNECNARLVDTDGDWWISMTPIEGMSWIYDRIYQPATEGIDKTIFVVEVDMLDNPYLSKKAAENFLAGLDDDERKAREHGHFVQMGGRVYKNFARESHVIDSFDFELLELIKSWEWYISLDHGFNNPTAILWHAVSPSNKVITFQEHYASEMTPAEHAVVIHKINSELGKEPDFWIADPALAQRQAVTGASIFTEYADHGCYFAPGNNDVATGIARINSYMRPLPGLTEPRWQITENCPNIVEELLKLRWATYSSKKLQYNLNAQEKIHKKDDHAADSARYFFSFMPDLTPQEPQQPDGEFRQQIQIPAKIGRNPSLPALDKKFSNIFEEMNEPRETKWKTVSIKEALGDGLSYD